MPVSYRFRFVHEPYVRREYPVTTKYDRGIYFKVPSEYALFYGQVDKFSYEDTERYLKIIKIIVPPAPPAGNGDINLYSRMFHFGIRNFINWAEPVFFMKPFAYWTEQEMSALGMLRDPDNFRFGYEFWFEKPDLKLVKEVILAPNRARNSEDTVSINHATPEIVKTVEYVYEHLSQFPTLARVISNGYLSAELHFSLIDGYWMMCWGEIYSYTTGGERITCTISNSEVVIHKNPASPAKVSHTTKLEM